MSQPNTNTTTTARHYTTTGDALLSRKGRRIGFALVGGRCPVCRSRMAFDGDKKTGLTYDHVTAHAAGGGAEGNLVPMCASCNSSKRDRDLSEWLPGRLVATGVASSPRGAARVAPRTEAALTDLAAKLHDELAAAGIWEAP